MNIWFTPSAKWRSWAEERLSRIGVVKEVTDRPMLSDFYKNCPECGVLLQFTVTNDRKLQAGDLLFELAMDGVIALVAPTHRMTYESFIRNGWKYQRLCSFKEQAGLEYQASHQNIKIALAPFGPPGVKLHPDQRSLWHKPKEAVQFVNKKPARAG
jgi:hypothetical protein